MMQQSLRVLLDVNVLLDAFLARQPFATEALKILQAHDDGKINIHVAASSLPNIFYLGRSHRKKIVGDTQAAIDALSYVVSCLNNFDIIWLDAALMTLSLAQPGDDLEDNLQLASALTAHLDAIITRDASFVGAGMSLLSPTSLLQLI